MKPTPVDPNQLTFTELFEPVALSETRLSSTSSIKDLFNSRLSELKISFNNAADLMTIEQKSLNAILDGTAKRIDLVNAVKLAQFLGLKLDEFVTVLAEEMESSKIGEIDRARKANFLASYFDLHQLKAAKFIKNIGAFEQIETRIKNFFDFQDINEYNDINAGTAFSTVKRKSTNLMRDFWVRTGYRYLQDIGNPFPYHRSELIDLMPKIRPYTLDLENGLATVIKALYRIGVTVVYQPCLPNVSVRGATFSINGKPGIVLTDYMHRYTTLWHVLIHELHHALYDLDEIEKWGGHVSGEPDLMLINEDMADNFARQYFFNVERSQQVIPFINDPLIIRKFAEVAKVHSSFVYAYHLADSYAQGDKNAWKSPLSKMIPKSEVALKNLNTNLFDRTIKESSEQLKASIFKF